MSTRLIRTRIHARQRGFTYLWLLFVLATGAAGLAGLGQRAGAAVQREREAELNFRGQEIARALSAYRSATPGPLKSLPTTLQELLDDRRGPRPLRHLRRIYTDPFTGQADWILVTTENGKVSGVHSRAAVVALRTVDLPLLPTAGRRWLVSDRVFASSPASAASAGDPGASAPNPSRKSTDPRTDSAPENSAKDTDQ